MRAWKASKTRREVNLVTEHWNICVLPIRGIMVAQQVSFAKKNFLRKLFWKGNFVFVEHFQNCDPKKKGGGLIKTPGNQHMVRKPKWGQKKLLPCGWKNLKNVFVTPGHRHPKIWWGKMCGNLSKLVYIFFNIRNSNHDKGVLNTFLV